MLVLSRQQLVRPRSWKHLPCNLSQARRYWPDIAPIIHLPPPHGPPLLIEHVVKAKNFHGHTLLTSSDDDCYIRLYLSGVPFEDPHTCGDLWELVLSRSLGATPPRSPSAASSMPHCLNSRFRWFDALRVVSSTDASWIDSRTPSSIWLQQHGDRIYSLLVRVVTFPFRSCGRTWMTCAPYCRSTRSPLCEIHPSNLKEPQRIQTCLVPIYCPASTSISLVVHRHSPRCCPWHHTQATPLWEGAVYGCYATDQPM